MEVINAYGKFYTTELHAAKDLQELNDLVKEHTGLQTPDDRGKLVNLVIENL
jgi:hypothetical protein